MPRQRTPNETADASGAIERNPQRYVDRLNAPKPEGPLGEPPKHFDDQQRDYWNEIVSTVPALVLTSADRILVEVTTLLLAKLREGLIKPVEIGHLRACLGSMGLTPADRTRVTKSDEPTEIEDELEGFVN